MIPVQPRPEPPSFRTNVKDPGMRFLASVPNPTRKNWKDNNFWRICFDDLYREYHGICAYLGLWINNHDATVDHFCSKSAYPQQAYDWENYRLSCKIANENKGDNDILDPFQIERDWFILDFPSLQVMANHNLLCEYERILVNHTIYHLKLNDEYFIKDRLAWIRLYIENLDFSFIEQLAPFIAYELRRQHLEEDIIGVMQFHPS